MTDLAGTRVMVVEDEELVAMLVGSMLEDLSCISAGIAHTVPEAIRAVEASTFDVALLDVNLAGKQVFPVAEALASSGSQGALHYRIFQKRDRSPWPP